jgi:hypothetical protein
MKRVIAIWIALSLGVLAALTCVRQPFHLGTGANSYEQFGWPGGWLTRNEYKTYVSYGAAGLQVDEHRVRWHVSDWRLFACGAFIATTISGFMIVGIRYGLKRCAEVPTSRSTE